MHIISSSDDDALAEEFAGEDLLPVPIRGWKCSVCKHHIVSTDTVLRTEVDIVAHTVCPTPSVTPPAELPTWRHAAVKGSYHDDAAPDEGQEGIETHRDALKTS